MPVELTDKTIPKLTLPDGVRQRTYWDTKLTGFGVRLSRSEKHGITISYLVNYTDARGEPQRETLGQRGVMSFKDAKAAATATLGRRAENTPTLGELARKRKEGPTIREGFLQYLDVLKKTGRPKSIRNLETIMNGPYFKDWLDTRKVFEITAAEIRTIHTELGKIHGPAMANSCLQKFGQMWNYLAEERTVDDPTWYAINPVAALKRHWFKKGKRRKPIAWARLPQWWADIHTLTPLVRDYNIFVMLTGLRRETASTARWDYMNLEDCPIEITAPRGEIVILPPHSMYIPFPKGGPEEAFIIPLSRFVVEMLRRRKADGVNMVWRRCQKEKRAIHHVGDDGWVFPTLGRGGKKPCSLCAELGLPPLHPKHGVCHLVYPNKTDHDKFPSPHVLRHTYSTGGHEAGVAPDDRGVLLNHAWATETQTSEYTTQSHEHLASCQEKITTFLLKRAGVITNSPPTTDDLLREAAATEHRLAELRAQITARAA